MYRLSSFKGVTLPTWNASGNVSDVGEITPSLIETVGGVYDPTATTGTALPRLPQDVELSGYYRGTSLLDVRGSVYGLSSKFGEYGTLLRVPLHGGSNQWCWARFVEMDSSTTPEDAAGLRNLVRVRFTRMSMWMDETLRTNQSTISTASTNTSVINLGNVAQPDVVVTITSGTSIYGGTITLGACQIGFSGVTVPGPATVVIDCGAMTITTNGTAKYDAFNFGTAHASPYWLLATPGTTTATLTINAAANSGTVKYQHYYAYA